MKVKDIKEIKRERNVVYWRTLQGDIRTLLKERGLLDRLSYWYSSEFKGKCFTGGIFNRYKRFN